MQMIYTKIMNYTVLSANINSVGVSPIHLVSKSKRVINKIGTDIYSSTIIGDCVIVSDDDNEIEPYFKELIAIYKVI